MHERATQAFIPHIANSMNHPTNSPKSAASDHARQCAIEPLPQSQSCSELMEAGESYARKSSPIVARKSRKRVKSRTQAKPPPSTTSSSAVTHDTALIKYGSLALLVGQMTGLVMLMRYSRTHADGELYLASTAVFMMEVRRRPHRPPVPPVRDAEASSDFVPVSADYEIVPLPVGHFLPIRRLAPASRRRIIRPRLGQPPRYAEALRPFFRIYNTKQSSLFGVDKLGRRQLSSFVPNKNFDDRCIYHRSAGSAIFQDQMGLPCSAHVRRRHGANIGDQRPRTIRGRRPESTFGPGGRVQRSVFERVQRSGELRGICFYLLNSYPSVPSSIDQHTLHSTLKRY